MSQIDSSGLSLTLSQKQFLFPRLLMQLFQKAWSLDYDFKMGYCLRSQEEQNRLVAVGASKTRHSTHLRSLAFDMLLFKDGDYLIKASDYEQLGEYWETLHPLCRWGGRFGDGDHFSIEDQGVK